MDNAVFADNTVAGTAGKASYAASFDRNTRAALYGLYRFDVSLYFSRIVFDCACSNVICVVFCTVRVVFRTENAKPELDE